MQKTEIKDRLNIYSNYLNGIEQTVESLERLGINLPDNENKLGCFMKENLNLNRSDYHLFVKFSQLLLKHLVSLWYLFKRLESIERGDLFQIPDVLLEMYKQPISDVLIHKIEQFITMYDLDELWQFLVCFKEFLETGLNTQITNHKPPELCPLIVYLQYQDGIDETMANDFPDDILLSQAGHAYSQMARLFISRSNRDEQNEQDIDTDTKQTETLNLSSLLNVRNSQTLTNPYVIITGIENYLAAKPSGFWLNLPGVGVDVKNMIHLWKDIYKYQNTSVLFKNAKNSKNETRMDSSQSFSDFLVDIRAQINVNKCNDGLIFYYSGHGVKDGIILANGEKYKISNIIKIFNGEHCIFLRNKPKIMIFDCCRGEGISETYEIKSDESSVIKKGPVTISSDHEWVDSKYHVNTGLATIFSNFEDFSISDSPTHGGCLTRSIVTVFKNPSSIVDYSLRELILGIRRQTKINSGFGNKKFNVSNLLVDFHETLEYKVYFSTNKTDLNDENQEKDNKQM